MIINNDTYEGNWLLGHITQFVLPLLVSLQKNKDELSILHGKYDRTVHPSPVRERGWPLELRVLQSGVLSICSGVRYTVPEMWTALHGKGKVQEVFRNRLSYSGAEEHTRGAHRAPGYLRDLMRERGKEVLFLPGRDVWVWAVMAAQRGIPFVYDSTISRMAIKDPAFPQYFAEQHKATNSYFMFDTGFAGTIPRGISAKCGVDLDYRLLSHSMGSADGIQLFSMKKARHTALHIEYYPKYMRTCSGYERPEGGGELVPKQWANYMTDVIRTAVLSIFVWYGGMKTKKTRRGPRRSDGRNQSKGKAQSASSLASIGKWW